MKTHYIKKLVSQALKIADFEDNEDTTGYVDFDDALPIGAMVLGWKAAVSEAFEASTVYTKVADGDTLAFVQTGDADTITDSENGFVTAGFEAGDVITVAGATSPHGAGIAIVSVAAGTLTLGDDVLAAAEPGIDGVSLTVTSTAAMEVGITGDVNKYSADRTESVAVINTTLGSMALALDAVTGFSAEKTPRVTVTEGGNFGALDTGEMIVTVYYLDTRDN
jgi:hypothetical protein